MAGWVCCLNNLICILANMWTCHGWMCYPKISHPFGNEYHTICWGLSGIFQNRNDIREGLNKGFTSRFQDKEYNQSHVTSLFYDKIYVILYSGFCALEGIIALKEI